MRFRRFALLLLLTALGLALGAPLYAAHVAPYLSHNLLHPVILAGQIAPYLLCGLIWLPWRAPAAAAIGLGFAAVLFLVAVILYIPILWRPGLLGGDMVGLALILVSTVTTGTLLGASAIAALVLWLRSRSRRVAA